MMKKAKALPTTADLKATVDQAEYALQRAQAIYNVRLNEDEHKAALAAKDKVIADLKEQAKRDLDELRKQLTAQSGLPAQQPGQNPQRPVTQGQPASS